MKISRIGRIKQMKTTKEIFEEMEEDYSNILGCSSSILAIAKEQLKEKDKRIKDLELQIETINKPLKK